MARSPPAASPSKKDFWQTFVRSPVVMKWIEEGYRLLWTVSSVWLATAYTSAVCRPPAGFAGTSQSLRKGAASTAYAIGTTLTDIRYAGGWSTNSTVLEAKYIDFTIRPSPTAWIFFG